MDSPRPRSALISGASIAGPALAAWLGAAGWQVTVVDQHGHAIASFPAGTDDVGGGSAEPEILRGQLSTILHRGSTEDVEHVFGDEITALHDDGAGADIELLHGPDRCIDLVVVAEGLRSHTKSLIMPDARAHDLGLYAAYLTLPRTAADDDLWRILTCGDGRLAHLRPDNLGTTRALLTFRRQERGLDRLPHDEVVALLRDTYADIGWEVPRILDGLDDGSLYVEDVGQARLPTWSHGRVALLGDAAHGASLMSGMSTTLSLVGAYVLAGELAGHDEIGPALALYEQVMRPLVTRAQHLTPGALRLSHPGNALGVEAFRTLARAASHPLTARLSGLTTALPPPRPTRSRCPTTP